MKLTKMVFLVLLAVILAACSAQGSVAPAVAESPDITAPASSPSASSITQPTEAPSSSPTPTPAKVTDLILEAKRWETAQFPVYDEEAMKADMDEKTIEETLNMLSILFHIDKDTGGEIPVFAPYDGVARFSTFKAGDESGSVIQFAKLDEEWDGYWDSEKFSKEEAFPVFISADEIKAVESAEATVKKGQIVGCIIYNDIAESKYCKNPGNIAISTTYGLYIYKNAASPYEFLTKYLGY